MTAAPLLAFAAAACGVVAAWDLGASAGPPAALAARWSRLLAPLRRAAPGETVAAAAERRRLARVLAGAGGAAGALVAGPVAGVTCAAAAPWVLARFVAARRARWREQLADDAAAGARAIADALAAGRSVRGAIATAAETGCGAAGTVELRRAAAALALGATTEVALEQLRVRAAAPAWDTIVAAILLQRDAGGDLAGLLRDIATDLDAARRAAADARAATAQARITAQIVGALPAGALVLGELAAPGTLARMLGAPLPALLTLAAGGLEAAGAMLVRRLARVGAPS